VVRNGTPPKALGSYLRADVYALTSSAMMDGGEEIVGSSRKPPWPAFGKSWRWVVFTLTGTGNSHVVAISGTATTCYVELDRAVYPDGSEGGCSTTISIIDTGGAFNGVLWVQPADGLEPWAQTDFPTDANATIQVTAHNPTTNALLSLEDVHWTTLIVCGV
jgi:hypothetical protein